MKKTKQTFVDGEVTNYYFQKGNYIQIVTKNKNNLLFKTEIGWKWDKMEKCIIGDSILENWQPNKNKGIIEELFTIHNSLKKQKYKNESKKQMIIALMIIIHEIKEQIFIQKKLF